MAETSDVTILVGSDPSLLDLVTTETAVCIVALGSACEGPSTVTGRCVLFSSGTACV